MCFATAAGWAYFAITAAATAATAYGQYEQGQYNAQVAANNAALADRNAKIAKARGEIAAEKAQREGDALLGRQRAAAAAQGADVSTPGTALDVFASTAGLTQLDKSTARWNAANEAYGYTFQAAQDRTAGAFARYSGSLGAGATLLTGAGNSFMGGLQADSAFLKYKKA